jgi:protein-disulfide isomerase
MKISNVITLVTGLLIGALVGHFITPLKGPSAPPPSRAMAAAPAAPARPANRPPADPSVYRVPLEDSPAEGNPEALVTLVEFSDYQCPFCKRGDATVKELQQQYGQKLRVVMKQFPLSFHPHARPSALAALAAGQQGKYWGMHDRLFANPQAEDDAGLEQSAKELGLDLNKWKADLASPALAKVIERDQALGGQLGVTGTPAFFINGRKVVGAQPAEQFRAVIDEELAKAEALTRSGVSAKDVYTHQMQNALARAAAPAAPGQPPAPTGPRKVAVPNDAPAFGPKAAKVTIVEFSDFQCPFCSRVEPTVKQIKDTFGKDVKFVWMNEPLPFHSFAKGAAQAAVAAGLQGKFWPYHDKLFENQTALDRAHLEQYAQDLGLDVSKFKADMDSKAVQDKVEADAREASQVGANGTPNFFINGVQLTGAQPFEQFKSVIGQQLEKANKLLASGVKMDQLYDKATEPGGPTAQATP